MVEKKNIGLLLFVMFNLIIGSVSAYSIQFTDRSAAGSSVIDVYDVNGTHITTSNTTSVIEDLNGSVIIHVSPSRTRDYVNDPMTFIDDAQSFIEDNLLSVVIIVLVLVLVVGRIK
jgi:hypothetical protein